PRATRPGRRVPPLRRTAPRSCRIRPHGFSVRRRRAGPGARPGACVRAREDSASAGSGELQPQTERRAACGVAVGDADAWVTRERPEREEGGILDVLDPGALE